MLSLRLKFFATASIVLLAPSLAASKPERTRAVEPIFGLQYDMARVEFEAAPQEIYDACRDLGNEGFTRRSFVFAKTGDAHSELIVLGGFFVPKDGRSLETDPQGAVAQITNGTCKLLGAVRDVFDYPPEDVPSAKMQNLANDAACRYEKAFGGYPNVRSKLRAKRVNAGTLRSAALKAAFSSVPKNCGH